MDIKFTAEQRLILINQYSILEKLYPEDSNFYARNREILENGYTLHYNDLTQNVYEEMTESEQREVLDILTMYRVMYFSLKNRSTQEKYRNKKISFPGFDGNEETKLLSYTLWFIFKLDRFDELKKEDSFGSYNTHHETIGTYRKMLSYWNSLPNKNELTDESLDWLLQNSVYGTVENA